MHTQGIDQDKIKLTKTVSLGGNIDPKFRFDFHILKLSSKASMLLNFLSRLEKFTGKKKKR